VQNVIIREHNNGRAILDVDTNQSAGSLVQMLRDRTRLGIFVDAVSGNSAKLIVS